MSDVKSVRFRQEQMSVFNGNDCPLSAGFGVRNRRNMHFFEMRLKWLKLNRNFEILKGF